MGKLGNCLSSMSFQEKSLGPKASVAVCKEEQTVRTCAATPNRQHLAPQPRSEKSVNPVRTKVDFQAP